MTIKTSSSITWAAIPAISAGEKCSLTGEKQLRP